MRGTKGEDLLGRRDVAGGKTQENAGAREHGSWNPRGDASIHPPIVVEVTAF